MYHSLITTLLGGSTLSVCRLAVVVPASGKLNPNEPTEGMDQYLGTIVPVVHKPGSNGSTTQIIDKDEDTMKQHLNKPIMHFPARHDGYGSELPFTYSVAAFVLTQAHQNHAESTADSGFVEIDNLREQQLEDGIKYMT
jgi:hypothetical protein